MILSTKSNFFFACAFLILCSAPQIAFGQVTTAPAPAPRPASMLQQNLIANPSPPPAQTPISTNAQTGNTKRQRLTLQLERRRNELEIRRENHQAPMSAPKKSK